MEKVASEELDRGGGEPKCSSDGESNSDGDDESGSAILIYVNEMNPTSRKQYQRKSISSNQN